MSVWPPTDEVAIRFRNGKRNSVTMIAESSQREDSCYINDSFLKKVADKALVAL